MLLVLAGVPGGFGQLAVDLAIGNVGQVVGLAGGFVAFEAQRMEVLPAYQGIGNKSNGGVALMESEGVLYPMDLGAFRNGNGMVAIIVIFPEDAQPSVEILDLMRTLDQRGERGACRGAVAPSRILPRQTYESLPDASGRL